MGFVGLAGFWCAVWFVIWFWFELGPYFFMFCLMFCAAHLINNVVVLRRLRAASV
jgi:hypothetical protein